MEKSKKIEALKLIRDSLDKKAELMLKSTRTAAYKQLSSPIDMGSIADTIAEYRTLKAKSRSIFAEICKISREEPISIGDVDEELNSVLRRFSMENDYFNKAYTFPSSYEKSSAAGIYCLVCVENLGLNYTWGKDNASSGEVLPITLEITFRLKTDGIESDTPALTVSVEFSPEFDALDWSKDKLSGNAVEEINEAANGESVLLNGNVGYGNIARFGVEIPSDKLANLTDGVYSIHYNLHQKKNVDSEDKEVYNFNNEYLSGITIYSE